ncbi:hypothetical protein [Paenibacillus alvei]|uniref:hypothetical protein n=1 Tax=Paenibacillus alvei TaxID=44250 RepID=UPI0010FF4A8D|nr:hypothetical protein [Paenibacillus alvei]
MNKADKGSINNQKRRDFNTVEMPFLFVSGEMGDAYLILIKDRGSLTTRLIIDFFEDRPLRAYNDVVIERKQS